MATMMSEEKCRQCRYEFGDYEVNARTGEWKLAHQNRDEAFRDSGIANT